MDRRKLLGGAAAGLGVAALPHAAFAQAFAQAAGKPEKASIKLGVGGKPLLYYLPLSAGPAATIIGDFTVGLARPRDTSEIRLDPEFHRIHKDIWASLRAEVQKAYAFE